MHCIWCVCCDLRQIKILRRPGDDVNRLHLPIAIRAQPTKQAQFQLIYWGREPLCVAVNGTQKISNICVRVPTLGFGLNQLTHGNRTTDSRKQSPSKETQILSTKWVETTQLYTAHCVLCNYEFRWKKWRPRWKKESEIERATEYTRTMLGKIRGCRTIAHITSRSFNRTHTIEVWLLVSWTTKDRQRNDTQREAHSADSPAVFFPQGQTNIKK